MLFLAEGSTKPYGRELAEARGIETVGFSSKLDLLLLKSVMWGLIIRSKKGEIFCSFFRRI
jgi:hypothetical protein